MNKPAAQRLPYPDLSYKIIGAFFTAWTDVGHDHKEIFYEKAVAKWLKLAGLRFSE